jgi:hypothetical protein
MNTQQKAPVLIADFTGQPVSITGSHITINPAGVVTYQVVEQTYWLTALAPGEATVTIDKAGSVGVLPVTVTAAPLTLTLGPLELK